MAAKLEIADSFEHWTAAKPLGRWSCVNSTNAVTVSTSYGLNGGKGVLLAAGNFDSSTLGQNHSLGNDAAMLEHIFTTQDPEWSVGLAFKLNEETMIDYMPVIQILDSQSTLSWFGLYYTTQCSLMLTPEMRFVFNRGDYKDFPTTKISGYSPPIKRGAFNYVEAHFTIAASGSVEMRLNGQTVIRETGVNTQATGRAWGDGVRILHHKMTRWTGGADVRDFHIDNVYVVSGGGLLNDLRIEGDVPTGNGATTAWSTPGAGSVNYQMVDEVPPDDVSTYLQAGAAGNVDTYTFPALSLSGSIWGVGINADVSNDDVDAVTLTGVVRQSGTDYTFPGAATAGTFRYAGRYAGALNNPATAAKFTASEINADEFGVKRVT